PSWYRAAPEYLIRNFLKSFVGHHVGGLQTAIPILWVERDTGNVALKSVFAFKPIEAFSCPALYSCNFLADHRQLLIFWHSERINKIINARLQHEPISKALGSMKRGLRTHEFMERADVYRMSRPERLVAREAIRQC